MAGEQRPLDLRAATVSSKPRMPGKAVSPAASRASRLSRTSALTGLRTWPLARSSPRVVGAGGGGGSARHRSTLRPLRRARRGRADGRSRAAPGSRLRAACNRVGTGQRRPDGASPRTAGPPGLTLRRNACRTPPRPPVASAWPSSDSAARSPRPPSPGSSCCASAPVGLPTACRSPTSTPPGSCPYERARRRRLGPRRQRPAPRPPRCTACSTTARSRSPVPALSQVQPWPAAGDEEFCRNVVGGNTVVAQGRRAQTDVDPRATCAASARTSDLDGCVVVNLAEHRALARPDRARAADARGVRGRARRRRPGDQPRRCSTPTRRSWRAAATPTSRPSLAADAPALVAARRAARRPGRRQGRQDRPDDDEDGAGAGVPQPRAARRGLVLHQHPRQPRRPRARRPGLAREQARHQGHRCSTASSATRSRTTSCASTTTARAATRRRPGTTSTSSASSASACRSRSTSCAATRSWPRRSRSRSPACSTSRSSAARAACRSTSAGSSRRR